jgi:release factor glutamine methyltransferase
MTAVQAPAARTAAELVAWAEARLEAVSATARLDAEVLLAESAGLSRARVMAFPERSLTEAQAARLAAGVARRSRGEPLAYVVGHKEFYALPLAVNGDVLVPRPETALLVDAALALPLRQGARVLDLGTGSGAIALALKSQREDIDVCGVDFSATALEIARRNAAALGLAVRWRRSDWFAGLTAERFDLVVTNPPYVASGDLDLEDALAHEPRAALDGGVDGLDAYRMILPEAASHLAPGATILLEHGFDQRERLVELAAAQSFSVVLALDDLAGLPRVLGLRGLVDV